MSRNPIGILVACVILFGVSVVQASQFAGGTGEYGNPYQIATAEQLISLSSDPNLLDKCFILVNEIDLGGRVFQKSVIGPFGGVFDGNGFCIRRLTMAKCKGRSLGLFESVTAAGEVKHLILEDIFISAYSGAMYVGTLAGYNEGVISRCSVSGVVFGADHAGGMVDLNFGFMEECRGDCIISANLAGGLVCHNKGRIKDCYAMGDISAESAGGFARQNSYTIGRCYSVCRVNSLISEEGGFLGWNSYPCKGLRSCYFLDLREGGGPVDCHAVSLTSVQMRQTGSFIGWDFEGVNGDGGRDTWFMADDSYPELCWLKKKSIPRITGLPAAEARKRIKDASFRVGRMVYDYDHAVEYGCAITTHPFPAARPDSDIDIVLSLGPCEWSSNPGTGDANQPYLILTEGQLDCLAYRPDLWDRCFRLAADIDMKGRIYASALIGRSRDSGSTFDGVFDGDGHIIRNLTIGGYPPEANQSPVLGLFGETGSSAQITNLGLPDVSIVAARHQRGSAGMLCAINGGYIGRCYCVGQLRTRGRLGGLAGSNIGVIEDCYAQGEVEGMPRHDADGLHAGLVAHNVGDVVRTCYSTCTVGPFDGGGLIASNEGGTVELCLWDVEASGTFASAAGKGLTTREMMTGTHGWGGNPNWIVNYGKDYPRLTWEGTPGSLIPASSGRLPGR